MLDTVLSALRGGDYAAAAEAARAVIAAEPERAEAHHLLSLSLRQLGDRSGAEAALEQALVLAPERAALHVSRAMLAAQRADFPGARSAFGAALQHDPNQLMAYLGLAELALAAGDTAQAEEHLRYAERVNDEHPHVEVMRAQVLLARGQSEAAVKLLTGTAQRMPEDPMVLGALGLAFLAQRHYAFAEQTLRRALERQPQAQQLRFALCHALLAQGRRDEAADAVEALIAARPNDPRALTLQGQIAAERGQLEIAIASLGTSLRLHPAQPHALDALLGCWLQRGEAAAAVEFIEALLAAQPRHDFAWNALVALQRSDVAAADAAAARWRQARPDSAAAAEIAAQTAEAVRDFTRADAAAEAAVALHPAAIGAQLVLARSAIRAGAGERAVARLQPHYEAATSTQLRRLLAAWLGRASDAAGRCEEAIGFWCAAHADAGANVPLPPFEPVPPLTLAVSAAPSAPAGEAPVLLWGAPGSGVDGVAALLAGQGQRALLTDRFGPNPRLDALQELGLNRRRDADAHAVADAFVQRWQEGLAGYGLAPAQVIDWLPLFDAQWLPVLQRGLPQARLLLALADPRDMLLNWLAFGSPEGLPAADPLAAAQWLARVLEHSAAALEQSALPVLALRAEQLAGAPAQAAADVAAFLALDPPPALDRLQQQQTGAGDLPNRLPAGSWRRYERVLNEPFALLAPIARRLDGH